MKIADNKRDRGKLSGYFSANETPTGGEFAELIGSCLNQRDDGVVKEPGEPLSIEAVGADTVVKKALNFYLSFSDPDPAFSIALGPRSSPGFSINDTKNNSRMCIDGTGNVGIGTTTPGSKLHVAGDLFVANVTVGQGGNGFLKTRHVDGKGFVKDTVDDLFLNWNNGKNVHVGNMSGTRSSLFISGNLGIGTASPENSEGWSQVIDLLGAANAKISIRTGIIDGRVLAHESGWWGSQQGMVMGTQSNHSLSFGTNATARLTIDRAGNVGIGTTLPNHKFHVVALDAVGLFESSSNQACLRFSTNEGVNNRVEIYNRPGGRLALRVAGAGDVFNVIRSGKVGINSVNPNHALHVVGDLFVTGRIGSWSKPPSPKTPNWGGGLRTLDVEAEGTVWSMSGFQSGERDLAENFQASTVLEPGSVVSIGASSGHVVLTSTVGDPRVIGVVSTKPGVVLNSRINVEEDGEADGSGFFPIALSGCVPCKVTDENGPIAIGDILSSASKAGFAMRALTGGDNARPLPGTIIGKALQNHESGDGVIEIFVMLH